MARIFFWGWGCSSSEMCYFWVPALAKNPAQDLAQGCWAENEGVGVGGLKSASVVSDNGAGGCADHRGSGPGWAGRAIRPG